MIIHKCYKYLTFMNTENKKTKKNELLLSTSRQFLCFDKYDNLDDVTVTIRSKFKLKDTNADIVEKHKYTWNITKDNANDKFIYLLLDVHDRDLTLLEKIQEGEYTNIFTISLVLLLFGFLIYFSLKVKGKRRNRV